MRYDQITRNCLLVLARRSFLLALLLLHTAGFSGLSAQVYPDQVDTTAVTPDSFDVRFETSAGSFTMRGHRAWSPLGAERLYQLAEAGYYDAAVFYRVGPTASYDGGKVVQFGLTNNRKANSDWNSTGFNDEPVRVGHRRGTVGFARDGPRTRTVELAIDLAPNTGLDTVNHNGVIGFPPVAIVVEGLEVLDQLNDEYGNDPMDHYNWIFSLGKEFLDREYPGLDRVITARIVNEWPESRPRGTRRTSLDR